MFSLKDKTALVTGASRGLGAGIAKSLAKAGADVVISYLSSENRAIEVVKDLKKMGSDAMAVKADSRKEEDIKDLFDTVISRYKKLDIFVNSAGTSSEEDIFGTTLKDWNYIMDTNLTSTFLCLKKAMEIMKEQNYGRIIINSSMTGYRGAEYGQVHYAASKGGQLAMAKTLARTAAPYNITVNAVAPGPIETEMLGKVHDPEKQKELTKKMPLGFGKVEDVGDAIVYFASDEAHYITGAVLDINGGMYMR